MISRNNLYEDLGVLPDALCSWYERGHRDLPWRNDPSPYHVWLSEIMLQQTRVEAVKPYYERFLSTLPDVGALAQCDDERLLKLWEGLGYYSRARNLKKAAIQIMEQHEGRLPSEYSQLLKLPGIGPYTAGAIASIAFGKAVPAVDGNVIRVVTRFTADRRDIRKPAVAEDIRSALQDIMPADRPGQFNQALMELGAMVCIPAGMPLCDDCPLCEQCRSHRENCASRIPFKSPPPERRVEEKTILVLRDGHYTLIHRREKKGLLSGMYEFPSLEGFVKEEDVLRYLEKELHLLAVQIRPLQDAKHLFSHIEWRMKGFMILVEDLGVLREKTGPLDLLVTEPERTRTDYPIPAAFRAYASALRIDIGLKNRWIED